MSDDAARAAVLFYEKLDMLNRQRTITRDGMPAIDYEAEVKKLIAAALDAAKRAGLEEAAQIASCKDQIRLVGGSTGNAWDTQAAIVAAIRQAGCGDE